MSNIIILKRDVKILKWEEVHQVIRNKFVTSTSTWGITHSNPLHKRNFLMGSESCTNQ